MEEDDLRQVFLKKQEELERMLGEAQLIPDQKKLILTAMEFGHAAAFCSRTCDMNESFYASEQYQAAYQRFKDVLRQQ